MTAYILSEVNKGKYTFRCPYPECKNIWEFYLVRHVIGLGNEAISKIEKDVTENCILKGHGCQQCPGCNSLCDPTNKGDIRLRCPACSHGVAKPYDFCWACQRPWNGAGVRHCGNVGCDGRDPRLKILSVAARKSIDLIPGCPSIRGCPKCGLLINHVDKCRHMICTSCKAEFCFICLRCWINNLHLKHPCEVAPVQEVLPDPSWKDRCDDRVCPPPPLPANNDSWCAIL